MTISLGATMLSNEEIRKKIIEPAIQKANDTMPNFFLDKIDEQVVFYGRPKAILDSLNLVSFVFILEEQIEETLQKKITITTQDVLNTETPPFASISNLCDFLKHKLIET